MKFSAFIAILGFASVFHGQVRAHSPSSSSIPMRVANNRIFMPVTVTGPTGKSATVSFWVDTGGDVVILSGRLARELELPVTGKTVDGMGESAEQEVSSARLSIGTIDLDLHGTEITSYLMPPSNTVFAGIEADGFLPARVLKHYEVVFDYPKKRFTLGMPGAVQHRGLTVPIAVEPTSGFIRLEVTLDETAHGFLLDTGAAYSGMSEALLASFSTSHPEWPYQIGDVGSANMVGKRLDLDNRMLLIPNLTVGAIDVKNVGLVSRPEGVYETYVSKSMSSPIVGVLAGNVLRQFRVDIDYPHQTAYFEQSRSVRPERLNCVGLVLRVRDDGIVQISGSAQRRGKLEVRGVLPEDRLLKVGKAEVTGQPLSRILALLSGRPGLTRLLTISRRGAILRLRATIRPQLEPQGVAP